MVIGWWQVKVTLGEFMCDEGVEKFFSGVLPRLVGQVKYFIALFPHSPSEVMEGLKQFYYPAGGGLANVVSGIISRNVVAP